MKKIIFLAINTISVVTMYGMEQSKIRNQIAPYASPEAPRYGKKQPTQPKKIMERCPSSSSTPPTQRKQEKK